MSRAGQIGPPIGERGAPQLVASWRSRLSQSSRGSSNGGGPKPEDVIDVEFEEKK